MVHDVPSTISFKLQLVHRKPQKCDRTVFCSSISYLIFVKNGDKTALSGKKGFQDSTVFVGVQFKLQQHSRQKLTVICLTFMSFITLWMTSGGHEDPPMIPGCSKFLLELEWSSMEWMLTSKLQNNSLTCLKWGQMIVFSVSLTQQVNVHCWGTIDNCAPEKTPPPIGNEL